MSTRIRQDWLPAGWTLRERYPFYDGPFIEFVLEHEDGAEHGLQIDRALLPLPNDEIRYLTEWIDEVCASTGRTIATTLRDE